MQERKAISTRRIWNGFLEEVFIDWNCKKQHSMSEDLEAGWGKINKRKSTWTARSQIGLRGEGVGRGG